MQNWNIAQEIPSLPEGEIQIWKCHVENFRPFSAELMDFLSDEEKERASRFYFERDRLLYITARVCLRKLLANYLAISPQAIIFQYTHHGKPFLARPDHQMVSFNISHSHQLVLIGLGLFERIGVDVERIRRDLDVLSIAKRFFSAREFQELVSLPPEQRVHAFFLCWTRKEALIKAQGEGLSLPLHAFDVSLNPDTEAGIQEIRVKALRDIPWQLFHLEPEEGYVGAVAVDSPNCSLQCFEFLPHLLFEKSSTTILHNKGENECRGHIS